MSASRLPAQVGALAERFRPVLSKRSGLALALWGEPGIGKSFALRELLRLLPCRSLSLSASAPSAALARALPRSPKLPGWAELNLERLASGEATEEGAAALGALLAALAPFVLCLEDLHEASPQGLSFTLQLARSAPKIRGAGLVVTSRSEPPEAFVPVHLEPLSRDASDRLLEAEVGAALPPEACAWMHRKAAGNPLYTLEFFRYLARQGFLWNDGGRWRWRTPPDDFLPATVEALIERLLANARTSQVIGYVLETRALLGAEASHDAWLKAARVGAEDLRTAIGHLEHQGIFARSTFSHPLFRELTLKTLSPERRRHLARRTVNALQDEPELAAQFMDDAELDRERALELLRRAAERAKDSVRVARFQAQAVRYAEGEERGRLALAAATALRGRDNPEALRLARLALEAWPCDEAVYTLAELQAGQHQLREAEATLKRLSARNHTAGNHGNTWPLRLARVYVNAASFKKLLELVETHPEVIGRDPQVDYTISYAYLYTDELAKGEALARRSLGRPGLLPFERARFLGIFEAVAANAGDYPGALRVSDERIALYRESQQRASLASALEKRAELLEHLGDYRMQLEHLREAHQLFSEVGDARRLGGTQAELAYALIQAGRYVEAEEVLLEARSLLAVLETSDSHLLVEAFLALLYYEWRPPHALPLALHHADAVMRFEGDWLWPIMIAGTTWVVALVQTWGGKPESALALSEAGIATAAGLHHHNIHAAQCYARALALEALAQPEAARLELEQAASGFRRAGFESRAQRVALEFDRLTNDLGSARARLTWFEEHGLQNGANIARRYFPDLAAPLAPSAAPEAIPLPRLEVLGPMQLRAEGLTSIRGRKRQELLALLLEARVSGRGEVSRLALLDAIYPGEDELKVGSSLKELVHGLRESLGSGLVLTTSGGYALGDCASDVEQFLANGETSLWRGFYLEGAEAESPVRESLHLALHGKAAELLATDPKEAARVGKILLAAEPYHPPFLRTFLRALRALANHRSLERHYLLARERMLEVGETLPERWQDFLADK